jgi:parallel beta-helix repeat protein
MGRIFLVVLFLHFPAKAHGSTYYVSKTGDDTHTCTQAQSPSTAKRTIKAGLTCLSGSDTLMIRAGTYTEGVEHDAIPSGLSGTQHTIVKAAPGEAVVVNGTNSTGNVWTIYSRSYITVDGIVMDGSNASGFGFRIGKNASTDQGSHYIVIQNGTVKNVPHYSGIASQGLTGADLSSHISIVNVEVYNCGDDHLDHGIYLAIRDTIIDGCSVHDNYGHGIHSYSSAGGGVHRNIIRNNRVYRNGSFGILIGSGSENVAYGNVVWGNGGTITGTGGMWIAYNAATGNKLFNNTIYSNVGCCIRIRTDGNAEVVNNICWRNSNDGVVDETGTATVLNNFNGDPCFVNAPAGNFALQAGSAAIDAGVSLDEVSSDCQGVSRPQGNGFDIGAFEFYAGQIPAPPKGVRIY